MPSDKTLSRFSMAMPAWVVRKSGKLNAGNHEPAWSHNLKANPEAEIEIGPKRSAVRARLAEGEERDRLWRAMNAQYEGFDAYKAKAGRDDIPVFALEPR